MASRTSKPPSDMLKLLMLEQAKQHIHSTSCTFELAEGPFDLAFAPRRPNSVALESSSSEIALEPSILWVVSESSSQYITCQL